MFMLGLPRKFFHLKMNLFQFWLFLLRTNYPLENRL